MRDNGFKFDNWDDYDFEYGNELLHINAVIPSEEFKKDCTKEDLHLLFEEEE